MADQVGTALARGSTLGGAAGAGVELAHHNPLGEWMSAKAILQRKQVIDDIMNSVMIGPTRTSPLGVHYGTLPGAKKPCLYKPGAEVLATTFGISPEYEIIDKSEFPDLVRYVVKCRGLSQTSGLFLGEGVGSCSSEEDAKKWRDVVLWEEYDSVTADEHRMKWTREREKDGSPVMRRQVRMYPPDVENACLKVAKKRSFIDMILTTTSASDVFEQDTDDLAAAMSGGERDDRDARKDEAKATAAPGKVAAIAKPAGVVAKAQPAPAVATAPAPASTPAPPAPSLSLLTLEEESAFLVLLRKANAPLDSLELILAQQGVSSVRHLARDKYDSLTKSLEGRIAAASATPKTNESTGG